MSLINREDLLKKQCSYYDYNGEKVGVVRVSDIVTAPEAKPKLIQCNDCKYCEQWDEDCYYCYINSNFWEPDWYCSRAERKEEP